MSESSPLLALVQSIYHKLVPEETRSALYRQVPDSAKKQLDTWNAQIFGGPLTRESLKLPGGPFGPARFSRRVNKICDEADWHGDEWLSLFDAMGEPERRTQKHRKAWEWAQGIYALQELGLLHEEATAIGVGAGTEAILYYLANRVKIVYATDIYGEGEFVDSTAMANMLNDPAAYAKIPYREDHLQVLYMNGLRLDFPDNSFDFAFTFSSIEHFGGHEAAAQAMREMARVVKPGGAVVVTSEVILNGHPNDEFFLPEKIQRYLVDGTGLTPIEALEFTIADKTLENPIDVSDPDYEEITPHLILKKDSIYYTSFCLVQQKST